MRRSTACRQSRPSRGAQFCWNVTGNLSRSRSTIARSGIYAGGQPVEQVSLQEAKEILWGLSFASFTDDPDRARAMAAPITPALVFGGLLQGRCCHGDRGRQSQAGKGYLAKVIAGVYADTPATVTQTRRASARWRNNSIRPFSREERSSAWTTCGGSSTARNWKVASRSRSIMHECPLPGLSPLILARPSCW